MKGKIKIMKTKPEITDEEIREYMDFDRLLKTHQLGSASGMSFKTKFILTIAIAISAGIFSWVLTFNKDNSPEQTEATHPTDVIHDEKTDIPREEARVTEETRTGAPAIVADSGNPKNDETTKSSRTSKVQASEDQPHENAIAIQKVPAGVDLVYVQAAPVDGYPHLYTYFERELQYPKEAMKDSIRGEVTAVFTINPQGLPEKIVIENSLGPLFDKEVLRLFTNMPPWNPATYNNKPVASKMSLPLTFQIKKITSQK